MTKLSDKSFLVTGGAGFIGSNLVERLLDAGARVRVIDDFSTGKRENLADFADRIDLHEASVTDRTACDAACADITAALEGRAPVIYGDGGQTRDFTYIENVVQANLLAATAPADGVSGEVFNVGCGDRISVTGLWEAIREALGVEGEAEYGPGRAGDVRDSLADLTKIRERLGYEVKVPLHEGLRLTADWLKGLPAKA